MPPGWSPSTLALAVIIVVFTSVSARVCVLGTEPDPADGGRIKLVLPVIDPCTCTEVRLGGHNAYAPQRPDGARFIDIRHLKEIIPNGLAGFYHCVATKGDVVSTDNPRVSTPEVTTVFPKSIPKNTTDVTGSTPEVSKDTPEPTTSGTTNAKKSTPSGSPFVVSTPANEAPVLSTIPEPTEPPADCQEILDAGQSTSGVYTILHGDQDMQDMQVYCRMESGKGYIVFQRRLDGSVSFNRTWQEYAEGFGDLTGEFWLGNQKLRGLTRNGCWELVITLRAFDGEEARVRYEEFELHWYSYWLSVSGFTNEAGHAGDSLMVHSDSDFSTLDQDHDNDWENCAEKFHGGWWYYRCGSHISYHFKSNLNGLYYNNAKVDDYMGIQWVTWKGKQVSLKGSEMMTRSKCDYPITEPPADCQDILDAGQTISGVYTIRYARQNMQVYCRMEPESGKGYIVFQRRQDGSMSFDRTWQEYAEGFGNLTGEFWLGNQKLRGLTRNWGWELVITLRTFDGEEARVRYGYFRIHPSPERKYELYVGDFNEESGDAGDSLGSYSRQDFSTPDKDNDNTDGENCAEKFHGGWWYDGCGSDISDNFKSNLNGLYYNNTTVDDYMGIQWVTWKGKSVSLKGCEMMTRRKW